MWVTRKVWGVLKEGKVSCGTMMWAHAVPKGWTQYRLMHEIVGEFLYLCLLAILSVLKLLYIYNNWNIHASLYRVRINYRRILQNLTVWFLPVVFCQGQCLRPTTIKDTTRIARVHQHHNQERHTRHAWEGLVGMGVSPGHLPCHTRGAHWMHLRSLWNCKHSSFKW